MASANPRVEALIAQLGYIAYVLEANTADLTHDDSLVQPESGGNCLNWVVGHIVAARNRTLEFLGKDPIWDEGKAARYVRGSEPIVGPGAGIVPFDEILAAFETSQEQLLDGLNEIGDDELAVMVPWFDQDVPKAVALAGMIFHEAYHLGQTGILRRAAGKAGAIP